MSFDIETTPAVHGDRRPLVLAAAVLLLGLGLSLLGARALRDDGLERERLHQQEQAAAKVQQLELALQLALESLTSVKAFHDAGGTLDALQFEHFVQSDAAFHHGTLGLGWAPRIGPAERAGFEEWLGRQNGRPEAIFEVTGHGLKRVVAACGDCYPVQYLTALSGGDVGPGVNLPSLPSRAKAIAAALASGRASATKVRRSDVWGANGDLVIQAFLPVRGDGPLDADGTPAISGLAMGVFDLSDILRRVFDAERDTANVALFDLSAAPVEQRLFMLRETEPADLPNDYEAARRQLPGALAHEFQVADRRWVGLFYARPDAAAGMARLLPLAGLFGGLLITALLALYLFAALVRGRQVSWLSGRLDGVQRRLVEQQVAGAFERDLRRQAQAVVSARSSFLQAASHDLRQPLHALGLYLGLLADRPATAQDASFMRRVQHSAAALHAMFDALLDLGRLESGRIEPALRAFDLAPLVERLGQESAVLAQRQGLRLVVRAPPAVVVSDPLLVERMLRNLLVNALRYTAQGSVALRLKPRGAWVDVQVMDTGPGIARERRRHIFEPYVRDARDRDGLGLGLAIVQALARELAHPLRLRSRVGRGSIFTLRLPRSEQALIAPASTATAAPGVPLQGRCLLLLDDDVEVANATAGLLRAWGAEVLVAATCAGANAQWRSRPPGSIGLLVIDEHLPDGSGSAWLQALRDAGHRQPALLVTADPTPALRGRADAADAVMASKPLTPLKLRQLVEASFRDRP